MEQQKSQHSDSPDTWAFATLRDYLQYVRVEKRLAQRTLDLYGSGLRYLQTAAQTASTQPQALQTDDLRRVLVGLHGKDYSAGAIAIVLSSWRGYYRWLGQHSVIDSDPTVSLKAPKSKKPLPKALGVEDAVQLARFRDTKAPAATEARDVLIVELLYGSGLRVSELVQLDCAKDWVQEWAMETGANATSSSHQTAQRHGFIDAQAGEVHVLGKGGKWRTAPVGKPTLDALHAYRQHRCAWSGVQVGHESALFLNARGRRIAAASVWHMLRQRSSKAGLAVPVHPHMLRHSLASHVLQSSSDLRAVQELLGHANIATTQVYTRLDFQHLAKTYANAHPRAQKKND